MSIIAVHALLVLQTDRDDNFVSQPILFHLCVPGRALIHISKYLLHLLGTSEIERLVLNIAILLQTYFYNIIIIKFIPFFIPFVMNLSTVSDF